MCVADENVLVKYNLYNLGGSCEQSDRPNLISANNSNMRVKQMLHIPVNINGYKMHVKFYLVPKLHTDFILGLDWLKAHQATLNFVTNKLQFKGRKLLFAAQSISVPPNSEYAFIARIRGDELPQGVTGVISGLKNYKSPLMIGKVLDTIHDNAVRVRCLNATDHPIEIRRNENVGQFRFCANVDHITSLDNGSSNNNSLADQQIRPSPNTFRPSEHVQIDNPDLTEAERSALCDLIDRYSDVFVGPDGALGSCDVIRHKIELTDSTPIRRRPYRLNPKLQPIMENKINELLKLGVIEESVSPWSAPCLLVAKQGGKDYRVVTDFRGLNDRTILSANALPTIAESLDNIGMQHPKYFTLLDLHSSFFQAELDPESKQYTAFSVPNLGLFQYTRLPQGLKNSPQTFLRIMSAVLRGLCWKTCAIYIDDVIVYHGQSFAEHLLAIENIFLRLRHAKIKTTR